MKNLAKILKRQADYFRSENNYIIKEALDKYCDYQDDDVIDIAVNACSDIADYLDKTADAIYEPGEDLTIDNLEELSAIASEFEKTGDPILVKQAGVLDEFILAIGANPNLFINSKLAYDDEINKIKARIKDKEKDPYKFVKEVHDKQADVEGAKRAISNAVKEYRPQEASLSTRTCPDHPGAQVMRIGTDTYQCDLDKNIYNYITGFTTMKGNKVPGTNVSEQTSSLFDRPNEITSFDTRESKLNS